MAETRNETLNEARADKPQTPKVITEYETMMYKRTGKTEALTCARVPVTAKSRKEKGSA